MRENTFYTFTILLCIVLEGHGWSEKQRWFSAKFMFGVSTSSYQIEGGWDADGKGEHIWDRFVHKYPERITGSATGDVSADSYHHYKRDVEMLRELGVDFYRFSISWARILPNGLPDSVNEAGLQYYDNLIDELLSHNIEPMVTLYHFDLPQSLEDKGGWLSEDIKKWFRDYAKVVFDRYAHKVKYWITINQPDSICRHGYGIGIEPPNIRGRQYDCVKNLLLSHAIVWHLYDKQYRKKNHGEVGIAVSVNWFDPIVNNTENFLKAEETRQFFIGLYVNPIFGKNGDFPALVKERVAQRNKELGYKEPRLPTLSEKEIKFLKGSADFLGMNHYTTALVQVGNSRHVVPSVEDDVNVQMTFGEEWVPSEATWLRSVPYGLYKACLWLNEKYDYPQVIITENGWATTTGMGDKSRVNYIRGYMDALLFAIEDGTNVRGYSYWSLMDNFEWLAGYSHRFGLYEVDFDSEQKTRKARLSALVYKQIVHSRVVDHKWMPKSLNIGITEKQIKYEL